MCRHCKNLVEDKAFVHKFMAITAQRLSEKCGRLITADEIDVEFTVAGPGVSQDTAIRVHNILHALNMPGEGGL